MAADVWIPNANDVFLRRELLDLGYDDRAIAREVRSGRWTKVRHGAYATSEVWKGLSPQRRHRLLCRAVLRTAHPAAALSHISAAVELDAPTWGVDLGWVHLTREDGVAGRKQAGVVRHHGEIAEQEIVERDGVRLVTATRAALEVTTVAGVEQSLVIVNGLLHSNATSADELWDTASALRHWPNSLRTELVLRLADPRIESAGESRTYFLCWHEGLPLPEPQVPVYDEQGWLVGTVDFAWRQLGVFLEFDGREKYLKFRRDGESLEEFLMRERKREELICALTGWVCIRITWADLERPAQTARRIRQLLSSRRRRVA